MTQITHGVLENAGGWRFVGKPFNTAAQANAFMDKRKREGITFDMKVRRVFLRERVDPDSALWQNTGPSPTAKDLQ